MSIFSDSEDTYKVALSMTRGITLDVVSCIAERGLELREFFRLDHLQLAEALGVQKGYHAEFLDPSYREEALLAARREMENINRHRIKVRYIEDEGYPLRMVNCHSAPIVLYQLGECDLNMEHSVGIVGTRKLTPYGANFTRTLVKDLGEYFPDLCVWSGLAYGVDATAHIAAMDEGRKTIAVVAHGLNTIYPASHRELAKRILKTGGAILTEYPFGTRPFRGHFLERNRIVAWSTDATVVIESEIKGGAMSTAHHAFMENRDVFALPGRVTDPMSAGCNHLIRKQKANIITSAADLIEVTGWKPGNVKVTPQMRCLFPELEGESKAVYNALRHSSDPLALDELHVATGIPISTLMGLMTELEFDGVVLKHPGNRYSPA